MGVKPSAKARKMEMMSGFREEGPYWQKAEPRQLIPRARAVGRRQDKSRMIMVLRILRSKVSDRRRCETVRERVEQEGDRMQGTGGGLMVLRGE